MGLYEIRDGLVTGKSNERGGRKPEINCPAWQYSSALRGRTGKEKEKKKKLRKTRSN